MPPRLGRLKRRRDFLRVAAARRKWVTPGLIVQVDRMPDSAGEPTQGLRVGFTVTRKVGKAVRRNRARRRLRAAASLVLPVRGVPGHDYVIIGRNDTPGRPFELLVRDLDHALERLAGGRPRA